MAGQVNCELYVHPHIYLNGVQIIKMLQNMYFICLASQFFSSLFQAVIVIAVIDVYHFNIKVFSLMVLDINDFDLWFFPQHCAFRMHDMIMYEMGIENSLNIHEHVFMQSLKFRIM